MIQTGTQVMGTTSGSDIYRTLSLIFFINLTGWAVSFEAPTTPSSTSTSIAVHDDCESFFLLFSFSTFNMLT